MGLDFSSNSNSQSQTRRRSTKSSGKGLGFLVLIIGLIAISFIGYLYFSQMKMQADLDSMTKQRNSTSYMEAEAYMNIEDEIEEYEENIYEVGELLEELKQETTTEVIYTEMSYSKEDKEGELITLSGVFSSLDLVREQMESYQNLETERINMIDYEYEPSSLRSSQEGQDISRYQGVDLKFLLKKVSNKSKTKVNNINN